MSRIKLLLDVVEDMQSLSGSLRTLAEAMMDDEKEPAKEEPKYTKEDVRQALAALSSAGKTKDVKELLMRHGGGKLSAIDPTEYAALMDEVKGM